MYKRNCKRSCEQLSRYVAVLFVSDGEEGSHEEEFSCLAEDFGHAQEQAENAYPDAFVAYIIASPRRR